VVLIHAKPCLALWYLLGWLVDLGGMVNKKKVAYIAGDMLLNLYHLILLQQHS